MNLDKSIQSEVRTGDDKRLSVKGSGDILIKSKEDIKCISNVFYVPDLKHNLFSIGQLLLKGHNIYFNEGACEIKDKYNALLARGGNLCSRVESS